MTGFPPAPLREHMQSRGLTIDALPRKIASLIHHAGQRGHLTAAAADRVAAALECHPFEIWPEWFDGAVEVCAAGCGALLEEGHGRRYCSADCRRTARQQRERRGFEMRVAL